jgi:hypothetical protein
MQISNIFNYTAYDVSNDQTAKSGTDYSSYEEAVKASEATKDTKAESILAKANSGQKLSDAELEYLAKKCPDAYAKIKAAMQEREMLEQQMKMAKSKVQATGAFISALSDAKQDSEDGYEMNMRTNQLSNAHDAYVKTDEYQKKDDEGKQAKRIRDKVKENKEKLQERIEKSQTDDGSEAQTVDSETEDNGKIENIAEKTDFDKVSNEEEQKDKEITTYDNLCVRKSVSDNSNHVDTRV